MTSDYRWPWRKPIRKVGDHVPLTDAYVNGVVFICIKPKQNDAWTPVGTGFFVGLPRADNGIFRYLVTANHVVDHGFPTAMRLRHVDGSISHQPIHEWIPHPVSDVAVAAVKDELPADAWGTYTEADTCFADQWLHNDAPIVASDVVYFIGLLTDIPSMVDGNIPMVRSGRIGVQYQQNIPRIDVITRQRRLEPVAHLIDAYSRGGFSGAPCYVEHPMIEKLNNGNLVINSWVALYGVITGHFDGKAPVRHVADRDAATGYEAASNEGVAVVVPVECIRQVLMTDDFLNDRRAANAEIAAREASRTDGATLDVSSIPTPAKTSLGATADLLSDLFGVPKDEADEVHRGHQS